jgi:hypothetical protein
LRHFHVGQLFKASVWTNKLVRMQFHAHRSVCLALDTEETRRYDQAEDGVWVPMNQIKAGLRPFKDKGSFFRSGLLIAEQLPDQRGLRASESRQMLHCTHYTLKPLSSN